MRKPVRPNPSNLERIKFHVFKKKKNQTHLHIMYLRLNLFLYVDTSSDYTVRTFIHVTVNKKLSSLFFNPQTQLLLH